MQSMQLTIQGRVQGVCFRAFVETEAKKLNLTGYVRNCHNGDVKVVAQGSEQNLNHLRIHCLEGPENAKVKHIIEKYGKPSKEFKTFSISY
jgi:acylphosphatase